MQDQLPFGFFGFLLSDKQINQCVIIKSEVADIVSKELVDIVNWFLSIRVRKQGKKQATDQAYRVEK